MIKTQFLGRKVPYFESLERIFRSLEVLSRLTGMISVVIQLSITRLITMQVPADLVSATTADTPSSSHAHISLHWIIFTKSWKYLSIWEALLLGIPQHCCCYYQYSGPWGLPRNRTEAVLLTVLTILPVLAWVQELKILSEILQRHVDAAICQIWEGGAWRKSQVVLARGAMKWRHVNRKYISTRSPVGQLY